jgi:hypothetical protein
MPVRSPRSAGAVGSESACYILRVTRSLDRTGLPMQVYFSHSYRDGAINKYFFDYFLDEEIPLLADQKTDVWCVAKLERFLTETTGFISIIPKRVTETDPQGYSPYIGRELDLARRARVPRLLFVDAQVLTHHRLDFPKDAVPFVPDTLEQGADEYVGAVRTFRQKIETAFTIRREYDPKNATVITAEGTKLRKAADDVEEILRREGFDVARLSGKRSEGRGLDDIRLLETLWRAELCVFMLAERLSEAHVALAMAHANCIPSVRQQFDPRSTDLNPPHSGMIRWSSPGDMLVEFRKQLVSYQQGLVRPDELAEIGKMKYRQKKENLWNLEDGPGLVDHVHPDHSFVRDEVSRVRAEIGTALGLIRDREKSMDVCRLIYEGISRFRCGYEIEQQTNVPGMQSIRTPTQFMSHKTATCLDLACLFASLLEAAGQDPLIVVLERMQAAHALVGYRLRDTPVTRHATIGDLKNAIGQGDAVLFEPTGAVESERPVGAETPRERYGKLVTWADAVEAGRRMVIQSDVRLKHLVDVREQRATSRRHQR